jgi:hypothetical protein
VDKQGDYVENNVSITCIVLIKISFLYFLISPRTYTNDAWRSCWSSGGTERPAVMPVVGVSTDSRVLQTNPIPCVKSSGVDHTPACSSWRRTAQAPWAMAWFRGSTRCNRINSGRWEGVAPPPGLKRSPFPSFDRPYKPHNCSYKSWSTKPIWTAFKNSVRTWKKVQPVSILISFS